MYQKFYSLRFFFISLLLSIGIGNAVNGQTVELYDENWTAGSDGTSAYKGDVMLYKIITTNTTSSNITGSTVYGHIPAGTSYVAGSTKVDGVAVSDVNGKMPFGSGGLINSPSSGPGILASNTTVTVEYWAQVNANMGSISNYGTFLGTTSTGAVLVNSNTGTTQIQIDQACNMIFQSTAILPTGAPPTYPYKNIKELNTSNGTAGTTLFTGVSGPCYNAVTGASLPAGSIVTDAEAMAFDRTSLRLYFINNTTNNPAQELCYTSYPYSTPVAAYKFVGHPMETNTGTGYNINRMTFAADGYGYALTANALDLIRFSIDPATSLPVISLLGPLVNDANNGANDVLAEPGGDIFGDASGKLYLIPNSGKLYRIDPATRVAVYLGAISGMPAGGTNAVAVSSRYVGGFYVPYVFIGGAYQNVYRVDLATMTATSIISSISNVWRTGDYTSCALPIYESAIKSTKSYTDLNGGFVSAGDPIEYTIEVTNTGNINAGGVKLYDDLPAYSHYIVHSTTVNGVPVADIGGSMPFVVSGGQFINSPGESPGIIKPGDANKVVIKFSITTDPLQYICNQATVTLPDADGSTMHVITDDPAQAGLQDATCFYSDKGPVSLKANKTYVNTAGRTTVVAGDVIEYTIEVTNTGISNTTGVTLYDAIATHSTYVEYSTTVNGIAVADVGGSMPFAVSGGQFINSAGQSAGVIAPGNKVVIKFRVTTEPSEVICNQATVAFADELGNNINIITDDPAQPGNQDATCFNSSIGHIVMKPTKTYTNTTGRAFVLSGDPIEYTIEITNTGNVNSFDAKLYDAIPAYSHYIANSTTMNGVAVADIGGSMPFAANYPFGQIIYSSGQPAGVVAPGTANKVVIKFRVTTDPLKQVCNQATVYYYDVYGMPMFLDSDDPATSVSRDATCFLSDGVLGGGRIAVNDEPVNGLQTIESVQARPNPFVNNLNLQVQLNREETVQVKLFDLYGRTVLTTFQKLGAGVHSLHLNVPAGLSKGIYMLEVKAGNNQVLQKKLLKQ